jgi:hypothetical protein
MAYIGQEPGQGQAERFIFTASGAETVVSTADDGRVIGYTAGQVSVYLNGVKLVVGTDCIATNGSTITGLSALSASDVVEVIALSAFSPSDTVSASGGTFTGAVTVPGFTSTGIDDNATSTAITIDASENVGIGTSSPANKIEAFHGTVGTGNNLNNTLALRYNATTMYGQHYMDGNGHYVINAAAGGVSGGVVKLKAAIATYFDVGGNIEAVIDSDGLKFNGDTAAANALDDYEEGTWTPSIYGANNSAIRTDNGTGEYTKVGNKVTLWGRIINPTSIFALDGIWRMDGLPFTTGVGMSYAAVSFGHKRGVPVVTNGTYMSGHLLSAATYIGLYWALNTTAESVSITGSSPTNLLMGFSFSYHV